MLVATSVGWREPMPSNRVPGDDDVEILLELLMLGAQKNLGICCTL